MNWNYRIVRVPNEFEDMEYGLYEVYYDDNGQPWARTQNPVSFSGDSPDEIMNSMRMAISDAQGKYLEDSAFVPLDNSPS